MRKSQPRPSASSLMRPGVDFDLGIDRDDFARNRREHVARRLDAFDHRGRVALFQRLADRRRLSKDNVAQLLLRVVADADHAFAALDADVFVVLAVADLRHHASPCSTAIIGVGMKRQRDDTRAQGLAAHHQIDRRSDRRVGARDVPIAIGPLTLGPNPPDVTTPIGAPSAETISAPSRAGARPSGLTPTR